MKRTNLILFAIGVLAIAAAFVFLLFRSNSKSGATAASGDTAKVNVVFRTYAPDANSVIVSGNFNAWQTNQLYLQKQVNGFWEIGISLSPGRYEYKFLVDSEWVHDKLNPVKVPVPAPFWGYNSIIVVKTPTRNELVFRNQPGDSINSTN